MDCYVAHDGRYIAIAFVVDSSDARSAEREHKPRARQNRHFSSDYGHPRLRLVTRPPGKLRDDLNTSIESKARVGKKLLSR